MTVEQFISCWNALTTSLGWGIVGTMSLQRSALGHLHRIARLTDWTLEAITRDRWQAVVTRALMDAMGDPEASDGRVASARQFLPKILPFLKGEDLREVATPQLTLQQVRDLKRKLVEEVQELRTLPAASGNGIAGGAITAAVLPTRDDHDHDESVQTIEEDSHHDHVPPSPAPPGDHLPREDDPSGF